MRAGPPCAVYFGIPEDMTLVPALIRQRVARTQPPADFPTKQHGGFGGYAGLSGASEPAHIVSFVQQCVVLYSQLEYLRGLTYYHWLVLLTSHFDTLLVLQGALALLVSAALLSVPSTPAPLALLNGTSDTSDALSSVDPAER